MKGRLHRRCSAAQEHAQDPHTGAVDFIAEAICKPLQPVLGGSVMSCIGGRVETGAGINEHDLTPPRPDHWQQRFRKNAGRAEIDLDLNVKLYGRSAFDWPKKNRPGAVY